MTSKFQDCFAISNTNTGILGKTHNTNLTKNGDKSQIEFVQTKMVSCHREQFMSMVEDWNARNGDPIMISSPLHHLYTGP